MKPGTAHRLQFIEVFDTNRDKPAWCCINVNFITAVVNIAAEDKTAISVNGWPECVVTNMKYGDVRKVLESGMGADVFELD